MPALDVGLLSSIPNQQADPLASEGKAFQLKDMINQEQLGQYKLGEEKKNLEDQSSIKSILNKSDLSTADGQQKAAAEVTKVNPKMGMDLLKQFQGIQSGKNEQTIQQYEILNHKNDLIGQTALGVMEKYKSLVDSGVSDTLARAIVQPMYQQSIQQLSQTKLPDGTAALGPHDLQAIQQNPQFDPSMLNGIIMKSAQARQQLQTLLAQRKQDTSEKSEAEKERHNRAQEDYQKKSQDVSLSDSVLDSMADQALAGDMSVKQNLGRGRQGAANIAALLDRMYTRAEERGLKGEDIAAKVAEFQGTKAGERALGTRTAQIGMVGGEFENMAPLALKASEAVPRGSFMPLTKAEQAVQKGTGNPELARFVAATNSLVNIYARAINPSGIPTDSDKNHAREMLNTAQSPQAYKAVVDQLQQEIAAAKKGPGMVREEFRGAVTGQTQPQTQPQTQSANPDDEARQWAQANPQDPRAQKIMQHLNSGTIQR